MNQIDKKETLATELIQELKRKIKLYKVLCSIQAIIIVVAFIYLKGGI